MKRLLVTRDRGLNRIVPLRDRQRALDDREVEIRCSAQERPQRFVALLIVSVAKPWSAAAAGAENLARAGTERLPEASIFAAPLAADVEVADGAGTPRAPKLKVVRTLCAAPVVDIRKPWEIVQ